MVKILICPDRIPCNINFLPKRIRLYVFVGNIMYALVSQKQLEDNWSFVCELLKSTCNPKVGSRAKGIWVMDGCMVSVYSYHLFC